MKQALPMKPRDRQILQIALPSIVSNITVPLLGLIDVAIVGHLGSPAYIGAIAVGGMLFNIIYWIFGFLRMGTSGMTSQAFGKLDLPEVVRLLIRSVGIGLAVAFCLILLQTPIRQGAFFLIHPTNEVREMATRYFHICIWGAPAMLGLYGLTGWFIGMQNSRIPMYIARRDRYLGERGDAPVLPSEQGYFSAYPLPGDRHPVLYFGGSFAGRNHSGRQHAADAALHFVLVCNGWFCLRRRGPERQIHRRTQPGSPYRHRPASLWMGSGNGSSLYTGLCAGR